MLIIEGPDNIGKTTLCKKIVRLAAERAADYKDESYKEGFNPDVVDPAYVGCPVFYNHMTRPNLAFDFFEDYRDRITTYGVHDRFHLGGLVWHQDVITQDSLRIIEGWLAEVGSYTIVMYATDTDAYRRFLDKDMRDQLFSPDILMEANDHYAMFASGAAKIQPNVDMYIPITLQDDGYTRWPDDGVVSQILDSWLRRVYVAVTGDVNWRFNRS